MSSISSYPRRRRVAVYSRLYEGSDNWTVEHGIPGEDIFVQIMYPDFSTFVPYLIQNVEEGVLRVFTYVPVTGIASVFELSPRYNHQKIPLENFTVGTFRHKYGHQNFITQFWNDEGYIVYPKTVQKLDNDLVFFEFEEAFTGYGILISNVDIRKAFDQEEVWSIHHWIFKTRERIILQHENDNGEVIIPGQENRIDENIEHTTDNEVEAVFPDELTGKTYGILYGIRI